MIKILFFASLGELAERDSFEMDYAEGMTIRTVVTAMEGVLPSKLVDYLKYDVSMVSINKIIADWDDVLSDGDELAFLPPFSGG